MAIYDQEGMIACPPRMSERWFKQFMARTETITIGDLEVTLQSVPPQWYVNHNDRCGMTGNGNRDTYKYMDGLFKNAVVSPPALANAGMKYFEDMEDIETPELLVREIEGFLRPGKRASRKARTAESKA